MPVVRNNNEIKVTGEYRSAQLRRMLGAVHHVLERMGYKDVVLDFSRCDNVFESGMLPLIPVVRNYMVQAKADFRLKLPFDPKIRALFHNAGWDHWIDPSRFPDRSNQGARHLPVLQFRDSKGQTDAVDRLIDQLSRNAQLTKDQLQAIEWSINEITDNVINHSESATGGFVQSCLFNRRRVIEFLVADSGIGIPRSLGIKDHEVALERAIQEGVTRNKATNQGNGLFGVYRIALVANGQFNLQSYFGNMSVFEGDVRFAAETIPYSGTFVRWSISLDANDIISRALVIGGRSHEIGFDYFDKIVDPERDSVRLKLKEEFKSFGSREAGREAYSKFKNVLNWGSNSILELSFSGINIISSSFADEVFGRLFVDLGPIVFMNRIKIVDAESEILGIIDKAISKRFRSPG
jgi:anti-sigma regulatory factor (Ser/Thr protein kinase)